LVTLLGLIEENEYKNYSMTYKNKYNILIIYFPAIIKYTSIGIIEK